MERVDRIMAHPLYEENFRGLQEAEKDRIFCRHDMSHLLDVARIAYIYVLEDGSSIPKDMIYAAALLHDIGRYRQITEGISHDEAGGEIAEAVLSDCGFSHDEINDIVDAVSFHRKREVRGGRTLAGYIYRADKICRRCFDCDAEDECYWDEERKIKRIEV